MYALATADQLRSGLGLAPGDNVDEERLRRALTAASAPSSPSKKRRTVSANTIIRWMMTRI